MDPSDSHQGDRTSSSSGSNSNSPPGVIWIIIPLVVVLLLGALIAISYRAVTRCRRQKAQDGDPEQAAARHDTAVLEAGDAATGGSLAPNDARRHTTPDSDLSQPTDRWGWVFDPNSSGSRSSRGAARISEGLNELGEAPPPYGEDSEGPKSCAVEMEEVGDGGEGPSGTILRQEAGFQELAGHRRSEAGSEPPAYDSAMGSGETSSVREPPPAVTPRSR